MPYPLQLADLIRIYHRNSQNQTERSRNLFFSLGRIGMCFNVMCILVFLKAVYWIKIDLLPYCEWVGTPAITQCCN